MSELHLRRVDATSIRTIGELSVDGTWLCYTLEDAIREGPKVPGETAIPAGRYQIRVTYSQRFKAVLPLLVDVPGFEWILIHAGNTAEDTEGCILVGMIRDQHRVLQSRLALGAFIGALELPAWITIENPPLNSREPTDE